MRGPRERNIRTLISTHVRACEALPVLRLVPPREGDFNGLRFRSRAIRMRMTIGSLIFAIVTFGVVPSARAAEDPKADYDRRAAERFVSLFQSLDLDRDGSVSLVEAQGDLTFGPAFDDMDINRDGIVTAAELQRFLQQRYGMKVELQRQQVLQR